MSAEEEGTSETDETTEAKPTITIAEKQAPKTEQESKPTITIAEREDADDPS